MRCWNSVIRSLCMVTLLFGTTADAADDVAPPTGDESILIPTARLEQLWNAGEFTEGVAVGPDGRIYFSDISRGENPGRILRFDPQTGHTDVFCADSGQSNGLMFNRQGQLIAACGANHGRIAICRISKNGDVQELVTHYQAKRLNSPNDLVIHPDGGIYFSDPRYVGPEPIELDHMSVYRFNPQSKTLTRVTSEITKPNGVILSPDARTLYVAETNNGTADISRADDPQLKKRMTLNAFPIQPDGSLGKRRILHDFGDQLGVDGMTVDTDGNIYAAVRSANRFGIVVFAPDGTERAYIPTPELPTNCCFGIGDEQHTLYITSGTGLYRIRVKQTGFHPATS